jgi:hypothetical protein
VTCETLFALMKFLWTIKYFLCEGETMKHFAMCNARLCIYIILLLQFFVLVIVINVVQMVAAIICICLTDILVLLNTGGHFPWTPLVANNWICAWI